MTRHSLVVGLSLALTLPAAATLVCGHAHAATGPAAAFVRSKHAVIEKLQAEKPSPERDKKIEAELSSLLDYDEMIKEVLGELATKRTPEEVSRFATTFKQLIQITYTGRLAEIQGWSVEFLDEVPQGSDFKVRSTAKSTTDKKAPLVEIAYVVRKKGSTFVVVDIGPEEAWYVVKWRKDIAQIVAKKGWADMVKALETKLAQSKKP